MLKRKYSIDSDNNGRVTALVVVTPPPRFSSVAEVKSRRLPPLLSSSFSTFLSPKPLTEANLQLSQTNSPSLSSPSASSSSSASPEPLTEANLQLSQTSSPSLSSSSSSFASPEPLTEANLQLFTRRMAHPNTPKKTQPSTPTNTPTTRSQKSSSTNAKLPIHQLLAVNNMPMEDSAALRRHPEILQWAQEVQEGQRNSAMKPASEQKLADRRRAYEQSNEDTFIRQFMSALLRDKRERKVAEGWQEIGWDQDGLMEAWNQSFQRDCIPRIEVPDAVTTKVLEANPRIKDPKPDITYGISSNLFSANQMNVNRLYYSQAGICPSELWHPFCIVEAKMKGTIQEAEYQCVRGGAALVNAARQLKYLSGIDNFADGPDMDTAMFSLAVITTSVVLHVHWAEVVDGKTLFHMHHVYTYALANKGVGAQLRHDLDNILDWGTLTRKVQITEMLDSISNRVKGNTIRTLPPPSTSIEDASTAGPDNNNEQDNVQDEEQDAEQDEEQDAEQDEEQDAEPHVNQEVDKEEDDTNPNQQLITNSTQVLDETGSPAHKRRRIT